LAHQALGISALFHVAAVLLMANDWRTNLELAAESSGTPRTISLEAVFVERNDLGPAVDFAPIQIQPGVAWIAERRFVDRPAVAQDWELPAIQLAEPTTLPVLSPRPRPVDLQTGAADTAKPMPRTMPTPAPTVQAKVTETAQAPSFLNNPPPKYPDLAAQRGWEGEVLLKLMIDETGTITTIVIERSSGHEILDAAAVNAVRRWRAKPATRFGRPVKTIEYLPVLFRL